MLDGIREGREIMGATKTTGAKQTAGCSSPADDQIERLAQLSRALADPIRLRMLGLMAQGRSCCGLIDPAERGVPGSGDPRGICVCEFQERFGLAQSKTSYHLRVLKDAGLINEETRGKWTFYSVDDRAAVAALEQIHTLLRA